MGSNRDTWIQYRETWQEFSAKLDQLQALVEAGHREEAASAFIEVEKARLRHNAARDRLAACLTSEIEGSGRARATASPSSAAEENRIRRAARLLWEFSGKPEHSAESDWRRAEELVRSASA